MADPTSLSLSAEDVRSFAAVLKRYHGKEVMTGQNDASNETDMMQDNLELSNKGGEFADARGFYGEMDANQRLDLAALLILGREDTSDFGEAKRMAEEQNGPDLDAMREMPLSPNFILSGLDQIGARGDNVATLRPPRQ
jgi:hypothetical protein